MTRAICYKEWIKTRRVFLLSALLFAGYIIYAFIHTGHLFRVEGAVATWAGMILKQTFLLPTMLRWLPLVVGILVSLAQFVPEMTEKRLKLTLHLPMPGHRILIVMLLHGIALLLALYLLSALLLARGLACYYPREILAALAWQALPWFIAGIPGYLFTAWACIEPTWKQRVPNALVAVVSLSACYLDAQPGSYLAFLPCLALVVLIAFLAPFYSIARFKEGIQ
ncbi:MAG: hypothetical protein LBP56_02980 [Odoribacteraceae bacterium]|jgi:hypothetical protein|nr:hypothetical protein [Odoribacteraceae bacterium]